jgi:hypothetical protein
MFISEWAEKLNGIEYPADDELQNLNSKLRADGIIAVCGASDDLLEFYGVIYDEMDALDGTEVRISSREKGTAFIFDEEENRDSAEFNREEIEAMEKIKAVWTPKDIKASWKIETEIPCIPFDIMEDGELYCRGVLIHIDSIKGARD